MSVKAQVVMGRHRTHRRHSTFKATIPIEMLNDRTYFTEFGEATPDFDQWICDNGQEFDVEYDDDGNPDVEDLSYEVDQIQVVFTEGDD